MKKICYIVIMIGLILGISACGKAGDKDKMINAEKLLTKIYSVDDAMLDGFDTTSTEEDIIAWASAYFGEYMTTEGLNHAMQNRILSEGISLYKLDIDIQASNINIEKRNDAGDNECYNYEVNLQTSEGKKQYSGSIVLKESDGEWLVDNITRQ